MAKNGKKIKAILDLLTVELVKGILYWQIAARLYPRFAHIDFTNSPALLSGTYQACYNRALLCLAKLGIYERESVSIEYLLNCASQNLKAFRYVKRDELDATIMHHRHLLAERKPFLEKVKVLRDRILAHLDRKHINEPEIINPLQIQPGEIEQTFEIFLEIINCYKGYYDQTTIDLATRKQELGDDIDKYVGSI
jgi:hypothetical protein